MSGPPSSAPLLSARGVVAGYAAADMILKGVDLDVHPGEVVAVIGPNGAGKSTLLKAIAGILVPSAGTITLAGAPIGGHPPREIAARGVAFVPQEQNVFPTMSVRENLEMGGFISPRETPRRIEAIFARFPVLAEKRRQAARTLSGGQRQILAMAMALMVDPKVLLLDEPSAGLSPVAAEALFDTIRAINAEGTAIAMVEQNALEALAIARRGVILVDGRNARTGDAAALAADPEVRRLFLGG
ncbi:ABC transporter ATP-binding protein [Elioraea sp.]|jgi:branched-chain amino acid transport system ATP-binding protein/neutral amino acid transport system ATP-binding protein|uniref:ABC transporter ATP-binding protein n=1 Tax=Elioraea sp. TaxID=2185103 RepID=UPI0021DEDA1F|nr:ABC transporter ATP-binding protein [Elioraea sp.]GIX09189.1 MAG: ABC transporter ATP-binding protein [Elioraea sp.]